MRQVAGSICAFCYALKGCYVFPNVQKAMEKRFASLTHDLWVDAMTYLINKANNPHFRFRIAGISIWMMLLCPLAVGFNNLILRSVSRNT